MTQETNKESSSSPDGTGNGGSADGSNSAHLNIITERNKHESESRRESLVSTMSIPGSIPGLEGVDDMKEGNSNIEADSSDAAGDSGRDSGRTVVTGNRLDEMTRMRRMEEEKVDGDEGGAGGGGEDEKTLGE